MSPLKDIYGAGWLKDLNDNLDLIGGNGAYTCVTADDTANEATIDTGVASADACLVQIYRSGVNVTGDAAISIAAGVITVADGASTYDVTAGDIIVYWAFES